VKVIVDTNLWISFLIGKKLSALKFLFSHPQVEVYVCDDLLNEFKDVSSRQKIRKYISDDDVQATFRLMEMYCLYISVSKKSASPVRDIKDLYLLSLADTIPADFIITGDKDLLSLKIHNQTKIVTYREFASLIKD
jgi:putative PIN family toxin of toxin-antitoxin system